MGRKAFVEHDVIDPVMGLCVLRLDAVLSGAAAVEALESMAKELEQGPLAEGFPFLWESLILRRFAIPRGAIAQVVEHNRDRGAKRNGFRDVRELCDELGLITRGTRFLWRRCGLT